MQKITTFLMFNMQAKEAAELYTSVIPNSGINEVTDMGEGPDGRMTSVSFNLDGQDFVAFDGGPYFSFSEGMSLMIKCDTQDEIDYFWNKLSEGGEESQCGWLKDRFGVSWQVVPSQLDSWMKDGDPEKAKRVMEALLKMGKLDIEILTSAYADE